MYHMEYEAGHSNVDDGPVIQCVVFNADPFLFHFFLLSYCSFKNSLVNICTKINSKYMYYVILFYQKGII